MKKEAKLLLGKAVDSLILSIEIFNRPSDQGRVSTVLILLDHAFEMLLKASILHKGGKIRKPREKQTIGFDECVRKAFSDDQVRFLSEEQTLLLQTINSLRDAAQHHLIDLSEPFLYLQAQAGLTLFRDLLKLVFDTQLDASLPKRVLPVSTTPPMDLANLFDWEVHQIKQLLRPGSRRRIEARAKLRALAIVEGAVQGEKLQPGIHELNKLGIRIHAGLNWEEVFPGVASINITSSGTGPSIDLRITKKEGVPVHLVPPGTPGATVIGIRRVNELDFYNLGRDDLAKKLELSSVKTTGLVWYLKIKDDPDCFKEIKIGKTIHQRYSQNAISKICEGISKVSVDDVWQQYRAHIYSKKDAKDGASKR